MKVLAEIIFKNTTILSVIQGGLEQERISTAIEENKGIKDKISRYRVHNGTDVKWRLEQKKCSPFPGTVCEQQDKGKLSEPSFE